MDNKLEIINWTRLKHLKVAWTQFDVILEPDIFDIRVPKNIMDM